MYKNFLLDEVQKELFYTNLNNKGNLSCYRAYKLSKLIGKNSKEMLEITKNLGLKIEACNIFSNISFEYFDKNRHSIIKYTNKELDCCIAFYNELESTK